MARMYSPKRERLPVVDVDVRIIRFHNEARLEVLDIARYAGQPLLDVVDGAVANICLLPDAWPMWRGRRDIHVRVLPNWRYSVVYTVDAESVFIVAIAHHKRRPGYWLSRL